MRRALRYNLRSVPTNVAAAPAVDPLEYGRTIPSGATYKASRRLRQTVLDRTTASYI